MGYTIPKFEAYIPNLLRCHNYQRFGDHREMHQTSRKLVENSIETIYASAAKPTNNSAQNQGITYYEMINLIKELKTLLELLRENLTNLTTMPLIEADPKKNPRLMKLKIPKNEPNKNTTQTTTNPKHSYYPYQTSYSSSPQKKMDNNESPPLTLKERSWKRESSKHRSRIWLIKTN